MDNSRKGYKELLRAENLRHSFTEGSQKTEVLKGVSLQVCAVKLQPSWVHQVAEKVLCFTFWVY